MRVTLNNQCEGGGMHWPALRSSAGVALMEVLIAGATIAVFMAGLFTLNTFTVKTARSGKEILASTLVVQERLEQLRKGTWYNVTDASYIQGLLSTPTGSASALPGLTERITINVYPAVTPAPTPIQVTRSSSGTATILSSNTALRQQPTVRADVTATWVGSRTGAMRTRTFSTVIAEGGIVR